MKSKVELKLILFHFLKIIFYNDPTAVKTFRDSKSQALYEMDRKLSLLRKGLGCRSSLLAVWSWMSFLTCLGLIFSYYLGHRFNLIQYCIPIRNKRPSLLCKSFNQLKANLSMRAKTQLDYFLMLDFERDRTQKLFPIQFSQHVLSTSTAHAKHYQKHPTRNKWESRKQTQR